MSDDRKTIMGNASKGYRSSEEKNVIRRYFDLPLLEQFSNRKGEKLRYFGLPGQECLDILTWKDVICEVAAVEKDECNLIELELLLDTQFPEIRYSTHWGDVDRVILDNRGRERRVGGEAKRQWVDRIFAQSIRRFVWGFDVINLDYFGKLLPGTDHNKAGRRTRRVAAVRRLFEQERLDSWKSWLLLITVEGGKYSKADQDLLKEYLRDNLEDSGADTLSAIEFLLKGHTDSETDTAQLIHGAAAVLVSSAASNANLRVIPRGTVFYMGHNNHKMVHMAYEFEPKGNSRLLGGTVPRFPLLRAPILHPTSDNSSPWFEIGNVPSPGTTVESIKECLDFLDKDSLDKVTEYL